MISTAPFLSATDVIQELADLHSRNHRTLSAAFYGYGEADEVSVTIRGETQRFAIIPVRCELELRHALATGVERPSVFLVEYDDNLPPDISGRLAGGRLLLVTRARRIARMFGAISAHPQLLASPVADALLSEPAASYGPITGATVDLETAWRRYLARRAGLSADGALGGDRLLAHFASHDIDPAFAAKLNATPVLMAALSQYFALTAGPIAAIGLRAWVQGQGRRFAALSFVFQVAASEVARNGYLKARVIGLLESLDSGLRGLPTEKPHVLEQWGELADRLRLRLEEEAREVLAAVIDDADSLLADQEVADVLVRSRYLPKSFERSKSELASLLLEGAARPTRDLIQAGQAVLTRLRDHSLAAHEPYASNVERARMGLRLLAYLVARPNIAEQAKHGPSYELAIVLAEHYAREGGFVDHARRIARGGSHDALGGAIEKVLAQVDALRDQDDEGFARALENWLVWRKADRVVPIELGLDRFGAQFLASGKHRKLLVLLLDGMAWHNVVELLLDLESGRFQPHYAPLRWRPKGADPRAMLPPMLAALPTITTVSRAALFAGALIKPGGATDSGKDPDRFAEHDTLGKECSGTPQLLLRGDVQVGSGDVSKKALDLVSSDRRVVGLVVNAIDEQLKGSRQMRVAYRVDTIKPLGDILRTAAVSGRAVLLVADHGHVLGARMGNVSSSSQGGARWRPLTEGESPQNHEVAFEAESVWRPKGASRVAMLFRETDSYASAAHEGEHGGASLSEVVTPAVLIGADDLANYYEAEGSPDREAEVAPMPRPSWWDFELPAPVRAHRSAPPKAPTKAPKAPANATLSLPLDITPPSPPVAPAEPPAPVSRWRAMLMKSPVVIRLSRDKKEIFEREVLSRVELFADTDDGWMSVEDFARKAGVLAMRVPGVVSRMAEDLNLDGYEVIAHDPSSKQVHLDTKLLTQLFSEE